VAVRARVSKATSKPASRQNPRKDPLKDYKQKRDFSRTAEPKPKAPFKEKRDAGAGGQFVVQKHDARRVHYDLRLEHGGTLKSWAVTRGPSLIAGEKRLAVHTEDHPLQYLDFEGNIPKGEYGGGAMIVWDRGRWEPVFDADKGLKKGHLEFTLHGERLRGRWHLVRMRPRPGEKKEQWLLIKADDEFARGAAEPDITEEETTSAVSGRTTQQLAAEGELRKDHASRAEVKETRTAALASEASGQRGKFLSARAGHSPELGSSARAVAPPDPGKVKGARKGMLPAFVEPTRPQVTETAPSGPKWVHEIKYDGYRIQARIDGDKIRLLTRKALDWTERFRPIATALKSLGLSSALIDGEIVVEDSSGIPSFMLLQADLSANRRDRFRYFVFDLIYCEGFDLTNAALTDRKALLQQIVQAAPAELPIRFSEHLEGDGPTMFEHASRLGLEGIVSKRSDSPYRGGRGDQWLKVKGTLRQEFIILGYIPSTVAKGLVGALLLGYYDRGTLYYAGRVGTGYSGAQAKALADALEKIAAAKPELGNKLPEGQEKGVRWAQPRLVCEVEYRAWTADKLIRQSSFKGLREDRPAEEIVLETVPDRPKSDVGRELIRARLTHPERLLWPEQGVTKEGLAEFYCDIADWILPHIGGRVLSLVRHPSGVNEKGFFAKHAWHGLTTAVRRIDVGEKEKMLAIDNFEGLLDLAQAGVLEIHPWGSTVADLEHPDRLIFDLDPGEDVPWSAVIQGARDVRAKLAEFGLQSFVKTSGGKGLHVVLPIEPVTEWDAAKKFTQSIAETMGKEQPERYLANMSKAKRRGRIFIDYLRNGRGATAVAAYSTRALPAASVSTPLAWDELSEEIRADHFRIDNLRQRLDVLKEDPWPEFFTLKQRLP
jgi:bifunctional non-homologous end joining protein LigD